MRLAVWLGLVGLLGVPSAAHGYTFGPTITGLGPEQQVFDWTTERCEEWDIPDQAARAFKDDRGRVQLHFSHHEARRNIDPAGSLNTASTMGHHDCTVNSWSARNPDPAKYDNFTWIASPYTLDGRTVYSLVHQEYRGWNYGCQPPPGGNATNCWYNAITLSTSTNSGDLFTHTAAPSHLVASMPDRWVAPTGPYGFYAPSNIVRRQLGDGYYYYAMMRGKEPGGSDITCLMRTKTLSDPKSWRGWNGSAFNVRFINPYTETPANRADHVCKAINTLSFVGGASESLTYNTYFKKFMLVGAVGAYGDAGAGFYYLLSDDLINWTAPKLLIGRETSQSYQCGDPDPVRDPSVLDPASTSRNFETVGRDAYVYYKLMHASGCGFPPDRDVMRVPIRFNGTPPVATFTTSANPALVGSAVTFNAAATSDPGGNPITKYEWDFDGNGFYESSGSNPVITKTFTQARSGKVGLRVTDSEGFQDMAQAQFDVNVKFNFQPDNVTIPTSYVRDSGAPWSDTLGYGWVRQDSLASATHTPLDLRANVRDRDPSDVDQYEQKLDTLIFMQYPQSGSDTTATRTPGAWELAVPCGTYSVTVSAGDSTFSSSSSDPGNASTHRVNIEGVNAIPGFQPLNSVKFKTAERTVPVCDGRLTIDAVGGSNTKLNYVDVKHADPKINFQLDYVPVPATYSKDIGSAWSDTRGYGWVRQDSLSSPTHTPLDLRPNVHDRDLPDSDQYEQRLDTFIFMQYPQSGSNSKPVRTPGAFEIALPCGVYTVTVSVGDSKYSSSNTDPGNISTHRINAEGVNLIAGFAPTDSGKFALATRTISVCDGRLTIDAIGGSNTKLNYVNAAPVPRRVNFQPDGAPVPAYYSKDIGAPYNETDRFGWVREDSLASSSHTPLDLRPNTRDRDLQNTDQYDQKLDTLIFMGYPQSGSQPNAVRTRGAWEMGVPCGTYVVTVSVGDSAYSSSSTDPGNASTHRINIEGVNAIAGFSPSASVKFKSAVKTVSVCDGRLTIDAIGGANTKLNYVDVKPTG